MKPITQEAEIVELVRNHVNLADERLGAEAVACSDDFFAPMQRMLNPQPAQFIPGKYDDNGKWMDGWESRRRRGPGHDWCIVRLACAGVVRGVDLDTSHFTGNFPPAASLEGCRVGNGEADAQSDWFPLLAAVDLGANRHHVFALDTARTCTHVRVNLFPDGGLARLKILGTPDVAAARVDANGWVDLASALNGARALTANNEHFGCAANLLLPGRGRDMGDGWETRRRREPGNDWCIIALADTGIIEAIEVDTAHFKGNFPERCSIQAAQVASATRDSIVTRSMFWPGLLDEQPLRMDAEHRFRAEIKAHAPVSHVRLNIFPDGGVSRLRLFGRRA